jgi:hypothetical protein
MGIGRGQLTCLVWERCLSEWKYEQDPCSRCCFVKNLPKKVHIEKALRREVEQTTGKRDQDVAAKQETESSDPP